MYVLLYICQYIILANANKDGFASDTMVLTPFGFKELSQMKVGDIVNSNDNGTNVNNKIAAIVEIPASKVDIFEIGLQTTQIKVLGDSMFFLFGNDSWIKARDLNTNDILINSNSGPVKVNWITSNHTFRLVEIEHSHTLFISNENILVHNGPILAAACGIVCKIISAAGCGAGAFITGTLNPGIGILYAAVCTALDTGATGSCIATCLALPTP